jgi:hypothetical protein
MSTQPHTVDITQRSVSRVPESFARVLLVASVCAATYLDFFAYRAQGFIASDSLDGRLQGLAAAPDQYRIGIFWLAHWITVHLHVAPDMALAWIDCFCGVAAVLLLFTVFIKTTIYRAASLVSRWFGAAAFVLLIDWFLGWLLWLQKPETIPAAFFLALMLWLWSTPSDRAGNLAKAVFLVTLSGLLATFRADLSFLLNIGILLFVLACPSLLLALPRAAATITSLVGALASGALQLYLIHTAFPQASYGHVKLWQLRPNLIHATRWPPFVLFLLPLGWMVVQVIRRRFRADTAALAFLCGAVLFALLWITIGKIDEVRIFLPFALALTPLTAELAIVHVEDSSSTA